MVPGRTDEVQVLVTLDARLWRYLLDRGPERNPTGDRSVTDLVAGTLWCAVRDGTIELPSVPASVWL